MSKTFGAHNSKILAIPESNKRKLSALETGGHTHATVVQHEAEGKRDVKVDTKNISPDGGAEADRCPRRSTQIPRPREQQGSRGGVPDVMLMRPSTSAQTPSLRAQRAFPLAGGLGPGCGTFGPGRGTFVGAWLRDCSGRAGAREVGAGARDVWFGPGRGVAGAWPGQVLQELAILTKRRRLRVRRRAREEEVFEAIMLPAP
ncbi:LOW QUALITY PROTEIN: uncharacterized protein LOC109825370 [Asparagus officinalis]|uniref:LOW QUALITY PROTEIN: uncharacterized protein LOC109825370 n=1 Tax=Asparagus officinalis TaxID=4686 RepID=UPI00098E0A8D|nr:LOW QUALITY PROTEIN: uncharacterized protein LOC109825370 [Asparagus officinalis]